MNAMQSIALPKLSDRAMLVSLNISGWTARKLDRKITAETNLRHNASADAGRYNKALLAKDALAEVTAIASEARTRFYAMTLPWLNDGTAILTVAAYETFTKEFAEKREKYQAAIQRFVAAYPSFVDDAKVRLNGMFNSADYPSADDIADKFKFAIRFAPFPVAQDFRAQVSDAQAQIIREHIESASRDAIKAAMKDVWNRIAELVQRMAEKLKAYDPDLGKQGGVFRDSLVENVKALVETLPMLNLTGDADLTRMTARLTTELCAYDADSLREDSTLRNDIAAKAESILAEVSDFMA